MLHLPLAQATHPFRPLSSVDPPPGRSPPHKLLFLDWTPSWSGEGPHATIPTLPRGLVLVAELVLSVAHARSPLFARYEGVPAATNCASLVSFRRRRRRWFYVALRLRCRAGRVCIARACLAEDAQVRGERMTSPGTKAKACRCRTPVMSLARRAPCSRCATATFSTTTIRHQASSLGRCFFPFPAAMLMPVREMNFVQGHQLVVVIRSFFVNRPSRNG